jgi:long-subunit fatty acid transport protein
MTRHAILAVTALGIAAGPAFAAGLDRSGQSVSAIFADDATLSMQFVRVIPRVTGEDIAPSAGEYDDTVAPAHNRPSVSYTNSFTPDFNFALIYDQPYGADIDYGTSPLTSNLGGTMADLDSNALTFVARYKLNERVSVFGGVSLQRIGAEVALNGVSYRNALSIGGVTQGFNATLPANAPALDPATLGAALGGDAAAVNAIDTAYGAGTTTALGASVSTAAGAFVAGNGYSFELEDSTRPNFLIGAAYEIPAIALRLAGTYRFETEHSADTTESINGVTTAGDVDFVSPASFNLEFQTGIAAGTLLTASYRWTDFTAIELIPDVLQSDLVERDDGHLWTVGIGRQFTEKFAGSATILYEPELASDLVSPLDPTTSLLGLSLGGRYSDGGLRISGGVNYSLLGDARPTVGGNAVAEFEDNTSVSVGFHASFTF